MSETTPTTYIQFTVYVKHHIIDEYDDYRVEYKFKHCDVANTYDGTFRTYFKEKSPTLLNSLDVTDDYRLCVDINQLHFIDEDCRMVQTLLDTDLVQNVNHIPYGGSKARRYIQVVPGNEKWLKYVQLDDEQIEDARKMIEQVEKQTFERPSKKRRV